MDSVLSLHEPSPLPAEFAGRARLFRARMADAADVAGRAQHQLTAAMFAEYRRRNRKTKIVGQGVSLREDALRELEIRWRAVAGIGCIAQTVVRDRRSIEATDTRIRPERVVGSDWRDPGSEPALCVVLTTLVVNPKEAKTTSRTLVSLSLRALARFYQCSFTSTDEALLSEIARLAAMATPPLLDSPGPCELPCEHGIAWRVNIADFCDCYGNRGPCLNVRGFH